MKAILTSIFVFALAVCVQAGTEQVTTTTNVAPEQLLYGVGFYGAIDMGANLHQDRGGTRVFENDFGDTLTIEPKNNVRLLRRHQTRVRVWHRLFPAYSRR